MSVRLVVVGGFAGFHLAEAEWGLENQMFRSGGTRPFYALGQLLALAKKARFRRDVFEIPRG